MGRLAFQLHKICRILKLDTSKVQTTEQIIQLIETHVDTMITQCQPQDALNQPKILAHITAINDADRAVLQTLANIFYQVSPFYSSSPLQHPFTSILHSLIGLCIA